MSEADNPYLPPKAVVADVSPEPLLVRPMAVTIALCLIGARVLLSVIGMVSALFQQDERTVRYSAVFAAISLTIAITLGYFIAQGRNWARVVYLILTIIGTASVILTVVAIYTMPFATPAASRSLSPEWFRLVLVPLALSIAVVVLLFGPGRAWFRPRE